MVHHCVIMVMLRYVVRMAVDIFIPQTGWPGNDIHISVRLGIVQYLIPLWSVSLLVTSLSGGIVMSYLVAV